jgi:hypothetical protein
MMQWLARSAAAFAVAGVAVMAQESPARSGWTPVLQLRVVPSAPDGTIAIPSKSWTLQKGAAPIVATIVSGPSLCSLAIGGAETPALSGGHGSIWTTNGQVIDERAGVYTINLTSRWVASPGQGASAATTQTLSLSDGDSVVLDLLKSAGDANCGVRAATIEARVIFEPEDSRLPLVRYAADLWWVHAAPGAPERRQHVMANIDGATVLPLLFDRLGFPLPLFHPRQGTAQAFVHFRGALRVRTRIDGLVDVDIDSFGPSSVSIARRRRTSASSRRPARPSRSRWMRRRRSISLRPKGRPAASLRIRADPIASSATDAVRRPRPRGPPPRGSKSGMAGWHSIRPPFSRHIGPGFCCGCTACVSRILTSPRVSAATSS